MVVHHLFSIVRGVASPLAVATNAMRELLQPCAWCVLGAPERRA